MTEQTKPANSTQENPLAAPQGPYPPYNGGSFPPPPPGAYMLPPLAYPPPPDGSHPEGPNAPVPPPYMMVPPGVLYAYPPHAQPPGFPPPPTNSTPSLTRPKRKQVKMACTNCANACKRCDDNRPCERCVKYGTADTCIDGTRKERKKGVKRGPYKRRSKDHTDGNFNGSEWQNGQSSSTATGPGAIPPTAPYVPEGYYPIYYPPGAFIPHGSEGHGGPEGSPPHAANGQPLVPYFLHPGAYPAPFPPHYPPLYPGPPPPTQPSPSGASSTPQPNATTSAQASGEQPPHPLDVHHPSPSPTTINPADASSKIDSAAQGAEAHTGESSVPPAPAPAGSTTGKKRSKTAKGESRSKKAKTTRDDKTKRDKVAMQSALNADEGGENSG